MFTTRWQLFRLRGIPLAVDASWLIVVVLLTWTLANQFSELLPGISGADHWIMGLLTAVAFSWSSGPMPCPAK